MPSCRPCADRRGTGSPPIASTRVTSESLGSSQLHHRWSSSLSLLRELWGLAFDAHEEFHSTGKEGIMPTWLVPTLKWGGIVLAILAAVAILYVRFIAATPVPEAGAPSGGAPVALYWILFAIGVVAAIAGFVLEGRKRRT